MRKIKGKPVNKAATFYNLRSSLFKWQSLVTLCPIECGHRGVFSHHSHSSVCQHNIILYAGTVFSRDLKHQVLDNVQYHLYIHSIFFHTFAFTMTSYISRGRGQGFCFLLVLDLKKKEKKDTKKTEQNRTKQKKNNKHEGKETRGKRNTSGKYEL